MTENKYIGAKAVIIWGASLQKQQISLSPDECVWIRKGTQYDPLWMTMDEAAKQCRELVKCGCKTTCSSRCDGGCA